MSTLPLSFWQITIQILLAITMAGIILFVSHLFGQRGHPQKIKDTPYECGTRTQSITTPIGPFSIKFYRVALLFIIFDVSLAFLLPWAFSFKDAIATGLSILVPGLVFIAILAISLAYHIKNGTLDWDK